MTVPYVKYDRHQGSYEQYLSSFCRLGALACQKGPGIAIAFGVEAGMGVRECYLINKRFEADDVKKELAFISGVGEHVTCLINL